MGESELIFSVIMPCYNSEAYVKDAVDSLLAQTYSNWELIAVNDGSQDDTLAILSEYANRDKRIKVFSKENGGYATAINYGLEKISGDYFLMMGSDDRLAGNLFAEIVNNLDRKFPDMIGFRTVKYVDGQPLGLDQNTCFQKKSLMENASIKDYESEYPQEAGIFFIRDTSKCYKTDLLGDLRYFGKYGYDADGIFSLLFSHKSHSFCSIPIDGYYWTLRSDSVSAKTNLRIDMDRLGNWICYLDELKQQRSEWITGCEKKYILKLYYLMCKILNASNSKNLSLFKVIFSARKQYLNALCRYEIKKDLPHNPVKRFVFLRIPIVWAMFSFLR